MGSVALKEASAAGYCVECLPGATASTVGYFLKHATVTTMGTCTAPTAPTYAASSTINVAGMPTAPNYLGLTVNTNMF